MTNKLKYLIKISLNKKIKTKWFAVVNILLVILIVGLINIDTIISSFGGDFKDPTNISIKDNTNEMFNNFKLGFKQNQSYLPTQNKVNIKSTDVSREELLKKVKGDNKEIAIIIINDEKNIIKAEIISNSNIDAILSQIINSSINSAKVTYAMTISNIDPNVLATINAPAKIDHNILDKAESKKDENMSFIMGLVFPSFILPFFMLIIFLVQMIGGEINEEKTTRSMEIIISNVSPKTHFISKVLASNIFVLLQAVILIAAGSIGLIIRKFTTTSSFSLGSDFDFSSLWDQLVSSGMITRLAYVIPITIILMLLSFLAYSLVAGILASMTTSIEDFQQVQTPIILICVFGYYISMLSPTFEGSILIKIISYLPFISILVSPPLLLIGQIGIFDVTISFALLIGVIYLMMTYGMKIYKVGILNYSTSKLWRRMLNAIKD